MQYIDVIIEEASHGQRLDKALAAQIPAFSRNRIQQLIEQGCVSAEGVTINDGNAKVKSGSRYIIAVPAAIPSILAAVAAPLDIMYEDSDMLIINKQAGMTVHPAPGHADDTLVNALLAYCGETLSGIGGVQRPGIVHRIDKDTSGLLVVARHDKAHRALALQLATRTLKREYLAVVKGVPNPLAGSIEGAIGRSGANRKKMAVVKTGGKQALTHYKTEEILGNHALLRLQLSTGRTHQIRVHCTHIGHPLVGDPVYGRKGKEIGFDRQALHAEGLTLIHPTTGKSMQFHAPLPADMVELIEKLRIKAD